MAKSLQEIQDMLTDKWSNNACRGYVIKAMESCGYKSKDIRKVLMELYEVFDFCYLLNNFLHCSAYENVIFCWVMHQQPIIDSILGKLDTQNCEVKCISLIADETHLRKRLTKDVERGIRAEDVIERSVIRIPMYQTLNTIKIDTNEKTVAMIANEIEQI